MLLLLLPVLFRRCHELACILVGLISAIFHRKWTVLPVIIGLTLAHLLLLGLIIVLNTVEILLGVVLISTDLINIKALEILLLVSYEPRTKLIILMNRFIFR